MKCSRMMALFLATLVSGAALPAVASERTDEVQETAQALTEHRDPAVRAAALIAIGHVGTAEQRELLANFHSASSSDERLAAGAAQILAGDRQAVAFTAEQLLESRETYEATRNLAVLLPDDQVLAVVEAALNDAEAGDRRDLFRFLGAQKGALYDALTGRLTAGDEEVRKAALQAVVYTAREDTLGVAENLIGHRDASIRRQSLNIISPLAARPDLRAKAVELLTRLSEDGDDEIKLGAAKRLVELGEYKGAEILVGTLSAAEPDGRVETLEFLVANDARGNLSILRPLIEEVEADDGDRQRERELLYELAATDADQDFIDDLRQKYGSTHFDERLVAFHALGRTGRDEVRSMLEQNLGAGRTDLRRLSARGLGHLGNPESLGPLRSALSGERDLDVRLALIEAIGRIRDAQSVQVLRFLVTDRDPQIKLAIIDAFENLALPEASQGLELLLRDRDSNVQWRAFLVLLQLDPERASRHMNSALRSPPDTFSGDIDPYQLTSQARSSLYETMLAHNGSRVRATAAEHGTVHRNVLLPVVRKTVLSDRIEADVRRDLVHLLITEGDDDDLAIFQRVITRYSGEPAAEAAAWHLAANPSSAFEETFTTLIGDDDEQAETVLAIIGRLGLAKME